MKRRDLMRGAALLALIRPEAAAAQAAPAANVVTLRDRSGSTVTDWPMMFARPFAQGVLHGQPALLLDNRPIPSQAAVKQRWPDGSVKHAVIATIIPRIPGGGAARISFVPAATVQEPAPDVAALLARFPNFDATIAITVDGQQQQASARAMLMAGHFTTWIAGPLATMLIVADHSEARRYDMGGGTRPFRPIFHVTFWPTANRVAVRFIGENILSTAMQDVKYDVALGLDGVTVLRQPGVVHARLTRWTRQGWTTKPPEARVDVDHTLAYLTGTRFLPNFDTSLHVPTEPAAKEYADWRRRPQGIGDQGFWTKYMGTTGGRDDIGPYTGVVTRWLFTSDWRLLEIVRRQADLAAAWPLQAREGDPAKRYDAAGRVPAIGLPLSIYARPTLWIDPRDKSGPEDRLHDGPHLPDTGWDVDNAHQPEPYSALYTLGGDYFDLEQLQLWAACTAMMYDPNYKTARGPDGKFRPSGAIRDQVRGDAWVFRSRTHAAFLSPDAEPEQAYFAAIMDDAIAYWEGLHDIRGTPGQGNFLWAVGNARKVMSPLHFFDVSGGLRSNEGLDLDVVHEGSGLWQNYFVLFELGCAKEKGFRTAPLVSYLAPMLARQIADPEHYDPTNMTRYYTALLLKDGSYVPSWPATLHYYTDQKTPVLGADVGDGYATYAYGASTMIVNEPGGEAIYRWLSERYYKPLRAKFEATPKWAFLPRA